MKRLTYLALAILFLFGVAITLDACKKESEPEDNPPDPDVPVYSETGEATVGPAGGTIKVVDESSAINGASIQIPKGALNSEEEIQITEYNGEVYLGDGINPTIVQFLPDGLVFNKPIEISIPFSTEQQNQTNSQFLYFDPRLDSLIIEIIPITQIDENKKSTISQVNHFSCYFTYNDLFPVLDFQVYQFNNQFIYLNNFKDNYSNLKVSYKNSQYTNMEEVVNNELDGLRCYHVFIVHEGSDYDFTEPPPIARIIFTVDVYKEIENYKVVVTRIRSKLAKTDTILERNNTSSEDIQNYWLRGIPFCAIIDDLCLDDEQITIDPSKKYVVQYFMHYHSMKTNHPWTPLFGSLRHEGDIINNTEIFYQDQNQNCIIDLFEGGISGEPCPGTPTVTDIDGNVYNTVKIGNQCWMKENLKVGNRIDGSQESNDNNIIEKYCYDNDPAFCDLYGGLYTWNEMMQYFNQEKTQGICPEGWHIPTDAEWKMLEIYLGMIQGQADYVGWRGTNEGSKLKSTNGWNNNGNGIDNYSFTAIPAGHYFSNGSFSEIGDFCSWWASSEYSETHAFHRHLLYNTDKVFRDERNKADGRSVRCLKD